MFLSARCGNRVFDDEYTDGRISNHANSYMILSLNTVVYRPTQSNKLQGLEKLLTDEEITEKITERVLSLNPSTN